MRENAYHQAVMKMLRAEFPKIMAESNPATELGRSGRPDIQLCVGGKFAAIELKEPGTIDALSARSPAQRIWARTFVDSGGFYLCTADPSMDDIRTFLYAVIESYLCSD